METLDNSESEESYCFLDFFSFSLTQGTTLTNDNNNHTLTSYVPIRILRLNRVLYELVSAIIEGQSLYEITKNKSVSQKKSILIMVLNLVAKGYLSLKFNDVEHRDKHYPTVTIVIPVRNRPDEIQDCLNSLTQLDYPKQKLEIIVVDDGSTDNTAEIIRGFNVCLISLPTSNGPSACRNIGVEKAKGNIIAFMDSDCTCHPQWLKQLVPFFAFEGIGAIGGLVENYFNRSSLDKYEAVYSSLNMGKRLLFEPDSKSTFYVPTCNMLVKKEVFDSLGGFQNGMHLGEDVDFCWRLRKTGCCLLYVPYGAVAHKHRNLLSTMLKRRFDYGTSEPDLYVKHSYKVKIFPVPVYGGLSFGLILTMAIWKGIIPFGLISMLILLGMEFVKKLTLTNRLLKRLSKTTLLLSILKSTFSFYYYASYLLLRYYLIPLLILTLFLTSLWKICLLFIIITSSVDYFKKQPKINFITFLLFYLLENCAYQIGVFAGCLKIRHFKCYSLRFNISK